jgi:hypothetical protein
MAFFRYPRGHRVKSEIFMFEHGGLTSPVDTLPRPKRLKNPTTTAKEDPGDKRNLCRRRSSCLF